MIFAGNEDGPDRDEVDVSRPLILVVEDDRDVSDLIEQSLTDSSFDVETVLDGEAVIPSVKRMQPDLILLDLGLPHVDGLEILNELRSLGGVPTICVTARGEETDRIVGLEMGADDYVSKPFSPRELVARVRSVLRRVESQDDQGKEKTRLEFDGLTIDTEVREVLLDGDLVPLTAREFDLIVFLASSPKQVFTRGQLLEGVWKSSDDWQDPSTVTELIRRIRRKIEADTDEPRWRIQTVRGVGYRFNARGLERKSNSDKTRA